MLLYHGTSADKVDSILDNGITPRKESDKGNWQHTGLISNPELVYLTNCYALYYALNAGDEDNREFAIFEVDTNKLDEDKLAVDEDVAQAIIARDKIATELSDKERVNALLDQYIKDASQKAWQLSMSIFGTCSHIGTIAPEALTRFALISLDHQLDLCWQGMDPSIHPVNYKLCGTKYRQMMSWIFNGQAVDPIQDDDNPFKSSLGFQPPQNRDGIIVAFASIKNGSYSI